MRHLIARMVQYRLNAEDVEAIDEELPQRVGTGGRYLRNPVREGDICAAVVTGASVSDHDAERVLLDLQVFLNGPSSWWAPSRQRGDAPGEWTWASKAHLVSVDYIPPADGD